MNQELIEQIKQGTPLEYDIDNLPLLKDVLRQAAPNDQSIDRILGRARYYDIRGDEYRRLDNKPKNAIQLSSFLPKMIELEKVKDFFFYKANMDDNNWVRFKHQDITNFLNQQ